MFDDFYNKFRWNPRICLNTKEACGYGWHFTAALRPKSGDSEGATVATSILSVSSVGALKGDDQDTSSQQPGTSIHLS